MNVIPVSPCPPYRPTWRCPAVGAPARGGVSADKVPVCNDVRLRTRESGLCDLDLGRRFHGERGLGVYEQIGGFVFKGSFFFVVDRFPTGAGKKEGAFHVTSEACLLFRYECGTDHRPAWEFLGGAGRLRFCQGVGTRRIQ